ncbi:MAG: M23 family metallopeptidase, partial [Rhizomicrobium sp.]
VPEPRERPAYAAPKPATSHAAAKAESDDAAPAEKPAKAVKTAALAAGHFAWPVRGKVIGEFGAESAGVRSDGINIAAPADTPITAAASGTVGYAGSDMKSYGNLVVIRHDGNFFTAYAHASRLVVKSGDHVTAGQVIGYVGQTGDVDSPQLHFEIRKGREPQDPTKLLTAKG